METTRVDLYLANNAKYFPPESLTYIREKLKNASDDQILLLSSLDLKDPTTLLIISIVGGALGIDRFMLGDTGMGILKLLTGGVCGILTIIDWFGVQRKAREYNLDKLNQLI